MARPSHCQRRRIINLLGIVVLIACGEGGARAQEPDRKRLFAGALRRREAVARQAEHAAGPSSHVAARDAVAREKTRADSVTPSTGPSPTGFAGLASASPLHPSGFGVGRDEFVDAFYQETFGRNPSQQELDRLSRSLARGVSPLTLASSLWNSPEHRRLVRMGLAPKITFRQAYDNAIAEGGQARRFGFPLP